MEAEDDVVGTVENKTLQVPVLASVKMNWERKINVGHSVAQTTLLEGFNVKPTLTYNMFQVFWR